jgi:transposase
MKTLHVGIDVASDSFMTHLKTDDGNSLGKSRSWVYTPQAIGDLETQLLSTLRSGAYERVKIGLEATAFYDWHLADTLAASTTLASYQPQVYRLNALRVSRFHKGAGEVDKTDKVDASVIADFVRMARKLPAPHVTGDPYVPLKRLTRYRVHAVKMLNREVGHFLTHLFLQHSGLSQQEPLSHLTGNTGLALVEEFMTPEEIAQKPLEELVAFLVEQGKNHFPDPEALAKKVQQAARESFRLRPALARSEHFILTSLARNIRALRSSLKEIDKAVTEQFELFPNTLTSVPGIGAVRAAGILAEIGDIRRFPDDDALAKMAGLVWPRHQSSHFDAEDRRMLRSANSYLRYYLVEAANALRMHDATYRAFYESKYQEVPKHKHKRAVVLTARKLVRLVFALLSKGQLYRPIAAAPQPIETPIQTAGQ